MASSFAPAFSYHVFLSFRGEDTRNSFVGHLYSALEQKGIHTYKDNETLPRGESIGPALMKAIEESQIAVIVFSENYADSSWCLDELVHIMKCKGKRGQIILPIFYGVKPSELRKQKRKYGEAFAKHELKNKKKVKSWGQSFLKSPLGWLFAPLEKNRKYIEESVKHELENQTKVESWKKAVVDASNIAGWEFNDNANMDESKFIKTIVEKISLMLHPVTSSVNDNLVGIVTRMQDFKSKLQIRSGGVLMIGIWGGGGGGKTTLASYIYSEFSREFFGCCFVEDIREKSSKNGLEQLQEKILSDVLKPNQVQIRGVEEGKHMIKDRLGHRKVLIVLDDVDNLEQLKALAGSHNWFGEGSLIIITSRDEHLLNVHKVDVIHKISLLHDDEAMELFCNHALRGDRRVEDYEMLSNDVVSYAGGLPLALRVLGCFLCDKDMNQWRSAIARLKEIPDTDILGKLKVSFDGLKQHEQDLFLDIACFFRWAKKDTAMEILDACGLHPVIGIEVLRQKALITISWDGRFDMHDLVQEMGHHIVRGEHPKNPEKHSRVWKTEDVLKICAMDATTELEKIEAIKIVFRFQPAKKQEQDLHSVAANMKNLRYMESIGDPAKSLFNDLPLTELCCLILYDGLQKQLWEDYMFLPSLKLLKLHNMHNLSMTPDFNGLPKLERFILHECHCLKEIHPSIGCLEKLVFLSIEYCSGLEMFPPIWGIKKLEILSFAVQCKVVEFSKIQQQKMEDLLHLDLDHGGNEIASYIESCPNFLVFCWVDFFHNMHELCFLRKLNLRWCKLRDEDIGSYVLELPNLQQLDLKGNKFSQLSFSCLQLPRLKWLDVSSCNELVELSEMPSSIAVVIADDCSSLESFGDISNCKWLWKVSLLGDNKLGDGEILLDSMLQGNAIEDHFISVRLQYQNPRAFVGRFFRGKTFTKRLPHAKWNLFDDDTFRLVLPDDWCNDFCGFLIRIITLEMGTIDIIMKQEQDQENSRFEIWQDSNDSPEPEYDGEVTTHVGYVSFSSLRQTTSLNPSYNIISFSIKGYWTSFAAELVPRKSKDDPVQTRKVATDCSEFWDEENNVSKGIYDTR
uniref:TIR domain-containing protein n=1 Tax=Lactuca sativa TaxID=4236 RepID=A0A9R1US47_LACSA|nr:hypothetical protein LSAT_V11C800409120 [Lactuca sativa]